jgi:hypothetical protein
MIPSGRGGRGRISPPPLPIRELRGNSGVLSEILGKREPQLYAALCMDIRPAIQAVAMPSANGAELDSAEGETATGGGCGRPEW